MLYLFLYLRTKVIELVDEKIAEISKTFNIRKTL